MAGVVADNVEADMGCTRRCKAVGDMQGQLAGVGTDTVVVDT